MMISPVISPKASPVRFGEMIRVKADTPALADTFARDIIRMKTDERHSLMISSRVFPDMPNDVFLFTAIHWRRAHEAWEQHRGAFFRTMLGRDDIVPEPDAEKAKAEEVDMETALYTQQREMVEEAIALAEKEPGNPDALITVDMRMDSDTAPALAEVFKIAGSDGVSGTKGSMNKASRLRDYLKNECGVDPRDVVIYTPAHEPTSTYLIRGEARERFDGLRGDHGDLDFATVFGWFLDGVREQGLLQELDIELEN